jgi:hypothetical protein
VTPVPADGSDKDLNDDTHDVYLACATPDVDNSFSPLPRFGSNDLPNKPNVPVPQAPSPSTFADRIAALFTNSLAFILLDISDTDELMNAHT